MQPAGVLGIFQSRPRSFIIPAPRPPRKKTLEDLPDEILLHVWDHLRAEWDYSGFYDPLERAPLVAVSRRFYDLFLPLLYQEVQLENAGRIPLPKLQTVPAQMRGKYVVTPSLIKFTQVALRHSRVASAVQSLRINSWAAGNPWERRSAIYPELVDAALDVARLSPESRETWAHELRKGNEEAWLAVLLLLVSNLTKLDLRPARNDMAFSEMVVQRALNGEHPLQPLQKLECLRMAPIIFDVELYWDRLSPWIKLPSLRRLEVRMIMDHYEGQQLVPPPGFAGSKITDIEIRESESDHSLARALASLPPIASLKYEHADGMIANKMEGEFLMPFRRPSPEHEQAQRAFIASQGVFDPSILHAALLRSKDTLHTLWLTVHWNQQADQSRGPRNATRSATAKLLGSLSDFTALRDLRIRLQNVVRFPGPLLRDLLPSSLETLYLEECPRASMSVLMAQLRLLILYREGQMPNLRKVVIQQPPNEQDPPTKVLQEMEQLKTSAAGVGVEFEVAEKTTVTYSPRF
ncbi:hypothetical protein BJX61DRAFT_301953 [Aspergillus egyptiacus]|nr:hypothetical protein BJX61DRAFT_301953 [Aspergillus egyptiacus]